MLATVTMTRADLLRLEGRSDDALGLLSGRIDQVGRLPNSDTWVIQLRLRLALQLGEIGRLDDAIEEVEEAIRSCGDRGYRRLNAYASSLLGGLKLLSGNAAEAYQILSQQAEHSDIAVSTAGLGYGELFRLGDSFAEHLALLPACASESGRLSEAVESMLRLRHEISNQFLGVKSVLRSSQVDSPALEEYHGLHQGIDLLNSLVPGDQELESKFTEIMPILEFCKLRRDCVKSRVRWIIPEDHPGRGRARVRTNHRHRMTIRNVDARPNRLFCGISRGIGTQSVVTTIL